MMIKLSVVILNYNTTKLTEACLESVFKSKTDFEFEVLVSDNGSTDGSIEMVKTRFPQVKLIENNANLGFSKGNNVAIKQSRGQYVLLLNSDTTVDPDAFDVSVKYMDAHPNVGVLGGKLILPDGSLDKATRRKFPNPANAFLRLFGLSKYSDYNIDTPIDQETEIDATVGAYMMVRRRAIEKVGMLDEEYFMYGEDLDWCWQIKHGGYKIVYYPAARITHYKYGSSQMIPFRTIRMAHQAMKIFYRKHYAKDHNPVFNLLVYFGITARQYLVLAKNIFKGKKSVH
jgi:GT2 family glycosyltransferase